MTGEILIGDVREQLRTLPERSVHCVVTSPPYWALRDYGVAGQLGLEATPEEYVAAMVEARIAAGYKPPKTKGPPRRKKHKRERLLF